MPEQIRDPAILNPAAGTAEGISEVRRQEASGAVALAQPHVPRAARLHTLLYVEDNPAPEPARAGHCARIPASM